MELSLLPAEASLPRQRAPSPRGDVESMRGVPQASEAPSPAVALLSRYYSMSIAIASGGEPARPRPLQAAPRCAASREEPPPRRAGSPTGAEKSEIQKRRACFKLIGQARESLRDRIETEGGGW